MSTTFTTPPALPLGNRAIRSPGWWAMIWVVATEAFLFAYALFGYYYLASRARGPWPPSGPPSLTLAIPMTVILVLSSVVMWWAEDGIRKGNQLRLRLGLLAVFVMGLGFGILEAFDWAGEPFKPSSHAFGALFFTITGFHLTHVTVGLLMNLFVQIWAWMGKFDEHRHLAVSNAALYWHFVDVVWLFVFTTFYLTPRWG